MPTNILFVGEAPNHISVHGMCLLPLGGSISYIIRDLLYNTIGSALEVVRSHGRYVLELWPRVPICLLSHTGTLKNVNETKLDCFIRGWRIEGQMNRKDS